MYDVIEVDEPVHGSSGNVKAAKNGKLHLMVKQIDGNEIECTLWLVKNYEKASGNLFSLTCTLSQGAKVSSGSVKNSVLDIGHG